MAISEKVSFDQETPVSAKATEIKVEEIPLPDEQPRPPVPKTTALEAEVKYLDDIPEGTVTVSIAGQKIRILPSTHWFASANEHLQYMRMNLWAQDAVLPADIHLWLGLNGGRGPRNNEVDEMFVEYGAITGMGHPGKS